MGGLDRLRAAAKEAAHRGRAGVEGALGKARAVDEARVGRAEELARQAAARLGERGRTGRDELLARAGSSAAGAAVGERARALGRLAQRVPLLTAPADLFRERNNVEPLLAAVRARPDDALVHLWLGEALLAMQAEARRFEIARSVVNPAAALLRETVKAAAALGATPADPATAVLARARVLAALAVRAEPRDAAALHVLARADLATGHPERAVQPAKLAVAAASHDPARGPEGTLRGQALVTLARAYLALGRDASAANVARKAVDAGCSLGRLVLAELLYRGDEAAGADPGTARHRAYVEHRGLVTEADRRAYHGVHRNAGEVARAVLGRQVERVRGLRRSPHAGGGSPAGPGPDGAAPPVGHPAPDDEPTRPIPLPAPPARREARPPGA